MCLTGLEGASGCKQINILRDRSNGYIYLECGAHLTLRERLYQRV